MSHPSRCYHGVPLAALLGVLAVSLAADATAATPSWLDKLKQATQAIEQIGQAVQQPANAPATNSGSAAANESAAAPAKAPAVAATGKARKAQAGVSVDAAAAGVTVKRVVLGRPPPNASMTVSPVGQHVGWAGFEGSRAVMVVDGVAGPVYDAFMPGAGNALAFSDDGAHFGYLGRNGDEIDTVVDGKVLGHTPYNLMAQYKSEGLAFGPHGRHVYYIDAFDYTGQGGYRVVVDGVPGPTQAASVGFSPDGAHYAYSVTDRNRNSYIMLDGKRQPPIGGSFAFAADGRIVNVAQSPKGQSLIIGGRTLVSAYRIGEVHTSIAGRVATIIAQSSESTPILWVDGKTVDGDCSDLKTVIFSADGKHYIAVCDSITKHRSFAVVDGRKGREYDAIYTGPHEAPQFTADAAHAIYIAFVNRGVKFVVVDDKEFGPYKDVAQPTSWDDSNKDSPVSVRGGSYAFTAFLPGQGQVLIWNGKEVPLHGATNVPAPELSADGQHVFVVAMRGTGEWNLLMRDGGIVHEGATLRGLGQLGRNGGSSYFSVSPDGAHIVYLVQGPRNVQMHFDDRVIYDDHWSGIRQLAFTPDSRHVLWVLDRGGVQPELLHVDDQPVLQFMAHSPFEDLSSAWVMNADGSYQFLTQEANHDVIRYRVTMTASPGS